jgi:alkanesulfonate monooxygenase SsuD/methylene tetrahydromethanopterin reductase-like flavin-dependent oxidoreductase (luciferase family)
VRRAARLADAWMIGPNVPVDRVQQLMEIFTEERRGAGLAVTSQPIRRDVAFGRDRAAALETFNERSAARYAVYAANERSDGVETPPESRLIHGTVADCAAQIQALSAEVDVDPLIVRPSWPSMGKADVVSYIDQLGELVSATGGNTSS